MFGALTLPMLVAIWSMHFIVQDSPLYLYNSHIMLESFRSHWPFQEYVEHDWRPLPYWGAYALLLSLMPFLPPRTADQVLTTLTSIGLASALVWLRWCIAGWKGAVIVVPLAIVLSINILWTYGLHSFLLGAILYCITLGYWWRNRERMGAKHTAILAALLVAGYLCHLVSFGLSVLGIIVLALFTPGPGFGRRLKWTALGVVPSIPLMILYIQLMRSGGDAGVHWRGLTDFLSPADWLTYVFMADVPTIHHDGMKVPGGRFIQLLFQLPPPSRWTLIGLVLLVSAAILRRSDEDRAFCKTHRGWIALAAVQLLGGFFGPSDLGSIHGFLRERVVLLGFATVLPALRLNPKHLFTHTGFILSMLAAVVQLCLMWDYGLKSNRLVGQFMKAKPYTGTGNRVAAIMVNLDWEYRTSPVPHLSSMLGLNTGNLIWNNFFPAVYYFPIKYRSEEARRRSMLIGNSLHFYDFIGSDKKEAALKAYRTMMEQSHREIDVLITWSSTPDLDAINRQWFESQPLYQNERVRVFKHLAR